MKQSDEKEILTLLLLAADYDMNKQNEVKNMTHEVRVDFVVGEICDYATLRLIQS